MPAFLTWGGVALAITGFLVALGGAPDRFAGLGLGSDLIQAGATLLAGGLIIAALGQVLRALRNVTDRIEDTAFAGAGHSVHDDSGAESRPLPLPRAAKLEAASAEPISNTDRKAREPVSLNMLEAEMKEAAANPAARPPRSRDVAAQEPRTAEATRPLARTPLREVEAERTGVDAPRTQPRWIRPQTAPSSQPPLPGEPDTDGTAPAASRPPRAATVPLDRRPREAQATVEPMPRRRQPEPAPAELEPDHPAVVRSGIIGGMAYTLYSDGSIEAELPIGTVRFGSLLELQEHVKRSGAGPAQAPSKAS
jgi:hypothetical protein